MFLVISVTKRGVSLSVDLYLPFLVQVLPSSVSILEIISQIAQLNGLEKFDDNT